MKPSYNSRRNRLVVKEGRVKLTNTAQVYAYMKHDLNADREIIWVLHLNGKNVLLKKEIVSIGTIDTAITDVRSVFRTAIVDGAAGIIIVHNHPSGDSELSHEDRRIYGIMNEAGKLLGIKVVDFIAVGKDGYSSVLENRS